MGFQDVNRLAHHLENMLEAVRDGRLAFGSAVADLVLETLDAISAASQASEPGEAEQSARIDQLCQRLDQAAQGTLPTPAEEEPTPAEEEESGSKERSSPSNRGEPLDQSESTEQGRPPDKSQPSASAAHAEAGSTDTSTARPEPASKAGVAKPSTGGPQETATARQASSETRPAEQPTARTGTNTPRPTAAAPSVPGAGSGPGGQAASGSTRTRSKVNHGTVRVSTHKLDALANLASDMIVNLHRYEAVAASVRRAVWAARQQRRAWQRLRDELSSLQPKADGQADQDETTRFSEWLRQCDQATAALLSELERLARRLSLETARVGTSTRRLEEEVLSVRMQPVSTLFRTFPRAVRDIAKQLGRSVRLTTEGGETELDRKILEAIRDPLLHLVRNAVWHGIESPSEREAAGKKPEGLIRLKAWQQGGQVFIEVADDGRGIDPAAVRDAAVAKGVVDRQTAQLLGRDECLRLIFEPGFSTSRTASDIAGRGVGLDVVKSSVEEMRGEVRVASEVGQGTAITLVLPLTLAVARALLVRCGSNKLAVPSASVELTLKLKPGDLQRVAGKRAVVIRNAAVPVLPLSRVLWSDRTGGTGQTPSLYLVVVAHSQQRFGFLVDELIGEQEIVVKPLNAPVRRVPNLAGAAVLGEGDVVLVLHVPEVVAAARTLVLGETGREPASASDDRSTKRVLVVEDSPTARDIERNLLEAEGYQVDTAGDGVEALQKLAEQPFDLIVTDIQMPRMDGFELLDRVRSDQRYRDIPVLIVTTRDSEEDRRRGLEAGADGYLVKSALHPSELLEFARRLVG